MLIDDADYCDQLYDLLGSLQKAIYDDDGEAFVRLCEKYYKSFCKHKIVRGDDVMLICREGAINCATALFEFPGTLPIPLIDILHDYTILGGYYPLTIASTALFPALVDLFLRHGARADLGDPLMHVLDMLDYHAYLIDWKPKKSIYTLVTILCLPQMSVILETLKLLVWNTKDVNEVFNYYVEKEEGKLVQMAVLIMVAKELFSPPLLQSKSSHSFSAESMCAYQNVKQEFEFLATLEKKLLVDTIVLKDRMAHLMYVLALFELFDKAGDAIRSYLQSRESNLPREVVIEDVAKILKEARLNLKHEDIDLSNIDLFEPGMTLNKDGSFSKHNPSEYEFQSAKLNPLPNTRSRGLFKQHVPKNMFNPPWSPALRSKPQTYCYLRCCPSAFYKPIKVQNEGLTSATRGNLLIFKPKPSNLLASSALI